MAQPITGTIVDGKYKIVCLLGAGGFGNVYLAQQDGFDRQVALKILEQAAVDPEARARFEREAKILSTLQHPSIVTIYGYGLDEFRRPYLAMQYIEGKTLQQRLREEKLGWEEVRSIAGQICTALAAAHADGVIHRDLKPANLMLSRGQDGSLIVHVLDFGLSAVAAGRFDSVAQKLTQTGLLLGTPDYMSPEICRGRKADTRSDVYALGCIIYECLAGHPPFTADSAMGLVFQHATVLPERLTGVPEDLERTVFKALQKEPEARFQTMEEFANALSQVGSGMDNHQLNQVKLPGEPATKSSADRLRLPLVAAAIAGLIAICGFLAIGGGTLFKPLLVNLRSTTQPLALLGGASDQELLRGEYEFDHNNLEEATKILIAARRRPLSVADASRLSDDLCEMAKIVEIDNPKLEFYPRAQFEPTQVIIARAAAESWGNELSPFQACKAQLVLADAANTGSNHLRDKIPSTGLTAEQRDFCLAMCDQIESGQWTKTNPSHALQLQTAAAALMARTPYKAELLNALVDKAALCKAAGKPEERDQVWQEMVNAYRQVPTGSDRVTARALSRFAAECSWRHDPLVNEVSDKALAIFQKHAGSRHQMAFCYRVRALREQRAHDYKRAQQDIRMAVALQDICTDDDFTVDLLLDAATICADAGNLSQAIAYGRQALDKQPHPGVYDNDGISGYLMGRSRIQKALSSLYKRAGDSKTAAAMDKSAAADAQEASSMRNVRIGQAVNSK